MQTDGIGGPNDRLSSDEVDALRIRILGVNGIKRDVPAEGALTAKDIAEAFDVPVGEVLAHLDHIRAERAFSATPVRRPNQMGLLALAIVLFAAAGVIVKVTPHPMTLQEMEQKVTELNARRKLKPKRIVYPIHTEIDLGANSLPSEIKLEIRGKYTDTVQKPDPKSPMLTLQTGAERIARALKILESKAIEIELHAPIPAKPLPQDSFMQFQPGTMCLMTSNSSEFFPISPTYPNGAPVSEKDRLWSLRNSASAMVKMYWGFQKESLRTDKKAEFGGIHMPPDGFAVAIDGKRKANLSPVEPIRILPLDPEGVARKLELVLRELLRVPVTQPFATEEMKAEAEKAQTPLWTTFTISGPLKTWSFKVPTDLSKQYPTAADTARETEKLFEENVQRAAAQVKRLNAGERR